MDLESELTSLRQRLTEFARRFDGRTRAFEGMRSFFTEGLTRDGIRDLIEREPRETYRFFTRGIDFESLRPLPWYRRYPLAIGKVFLSAAYRLSPARRIALAAAIVAFLIGWVEFLMSGAAEVTTDTGFGWYLLSVSIFFILLMMELRDKLNLKGDLEVAREIQFGLVPSGVFERDGITIYSRMRPANTVGGDYYDIIELPDHTVVFVVGDVAGKGMPAALLMAMLQGSIRTLISAGFRGSDVMRKLNEYLCANIPVNRLVTLFYGELAASTGEIRYVNAGHNAPCLTRNDGCERLDSTATVLGFFPGLEFEMKSAWLGPGERLLLYTDGLTEAFNAAEEEYGEETLIAFLRAHRNLAPDLLIDGLIADVLRFCGAARPGDDITLMSICRNR